MCYFITAISAGLTEAQLNTAARDFGITFRACANKSIRHQLRPDESCFWLDTCCDCDTGLGHPTEVKRRSKHNQEKMTPSVRTWVDFIRTAMHETRMKRFGLLLHFYSGDQQSENFTFTRQAVSINNLDKDLLKNLQKDALLVLNRQFRFQ